MKSSGAFSAYSNPEWTAFLQIAPHDFYHLPGYTALSAAWDEGTAEAYVGPELLIALQIRSLPDSIDGQLSGLADAVSPYGYPAPIHPENAEPDILRDAFQEFVAVGKERGLVTTFLRLHPILSDPLCEALKEPVEGVEVVATGETVCLDLRGSNDLESTFRQGHAYEIRKLREEGYSVRFDDESDFPTFVSIYSDTMERVGAEPFYHFDMEYFNALRDCLGGRFHLAAVVTPEGDVASAGLFPVTGEIMQYHLSGTREKYRKSAASKLAIAEMAQCGRELGARYFHLGGGLGSKRDGLFQFKAGFGGDILPYRTIRVVHNPEAYAMLNEAAGAEPDDDSFFPIYRKDCS